MRISIILAPVSAALFAGCVNVAPPPNSSTVDPSNPSAPEATVRRFQPNLVASTRVYLDPSVAQGAQKMDHSKMQGMDNMSGMDHSKMPGMDVQQSPAAPPSKEALDKEMKKTSDEMKKLSDELKAKSDAAKAAGKIGPKSTAAAEAPAVIYTCSMHPEVLQSKPGKCPKCGMTLVPKEEKK